MDQRISMTLKEVPKMLSEVAPPGFGHTKGDKEKGVKKGGTAAAFDRARKEGRFKGSKSDMFAIMWSQKKKGDKPHYKPGTDKKYKKYQKEEASYKTRDKELKKAKKAMDFRHRNIHKSGDDDVNESSQYEKLKKKIGSKKMHNEPVTVESVDLDEKAFADFYKKAKSIVTKKKEEKKPQKAMDAGAKAKRMLARKVHAKYVSGSTDNVPDDIRDHKEYK